VCAGRCGGSAVRGDVGEALLGVTVAELTGEICWVCELRSVYCEGDAVNCCTGIANSGAMAAMGFFGVSTLLSSMEEVRRRMGWFGFSRNIQVESGIRWRGTLCMGGAAIMPEQCDNRLSAVSS
jgi:hypothetical protein